MLIVLSPAKSLDLESPSTTKEHTTPDFIPRAAELIDVLRTYSPGQVAELMDLSDSLAMLNVTRYAHWSEDHAEARQAIMSFNGDVYAGLDARTLNAKGIDYLQRHLRILSGLYGLLRPLDRMHPYRLEMGTRLKNPRGNNLYAFWGDSVTEALNRQLAQTKSKALVNLASEEYFKSVKPKLLDVPVITPVFEDWKNGKYKIISFFAKRARGMMARYAAEHGVKNPERLKDFDVDGYAFDAAASNEQDWVFRRRQEA
ncbi:peroxide stress protein YaaA [Massilia sp. IC2-477]|uniref:peroxide stress protein YaaA n=1 Tax=unclassified Massilia TaxID=2609279 RepID=UPI001D10A6C9|nr:MULTISPECIES: peroxide stress protein YaaA [unclassified Massilia]MCC2955386.1 peroxide stress protein YaaA [Massilia sp. IC2-477]MCC2972626.1 peroxide stress protein YaaA [Massilia sp. IC2-476]